MMLKKAPRTILYSFVLKKVVLKYTLFCKAFMNDNKLFICTIMSRVTNQLCGLESEILLVFRILSVPFV